MNSPGLGQLARNTYTRKGRDYGLEEEGEEDVEEGPDAGEVDVVAVAEGDRMQDPYRPSMHDWHSWNRRPKGQETMSAR